MEKEILSIIRNIGSELQITYKQNLLLKDRILYNKCYSAIYLLEDITEAFGYYKACNETQLELGAKYLMIYGVLEALYMQQQALNDLIVSLGFKTINYKTNFPEVYFIRDVRNDIAGHPTNRNREYATYLSRSDLSLKQIRYEETKNNEFINFDIISNIEMQEKFIKEQLEDLLNKLTQEKQEHINTFKNDKLTDCFQMFDYAYEKIYSDGYFYTDEDRMGFHLIFDIIRNLKEKLNIRFANWEQTNFISDIKFVERIGNYLLLKTEIINEEGEESKFLKRNLLENMFSHLEALKNLAKEVDIDYENNFEIKYAIDKIIMPQIVIKDENDEEVALNV